MKHLILIRCIAAAVAQLFTSIEDAVDLESIRDVSAFIEPPGSNGICSICGMEVLGISTDMGDIRKDPDAYFNSGRCPRCGYNTVHLGCALGSLHQIGCYSCGEIVCKRFDELDVLIEHLRNGNTQLINDFVCYCALNGLESMEQSLIVLTLRSYNMTAGELESLKRFAKKMGGACPHRPNIVYAVDCIVWVERVAHMQTSEMVTFLADTRALAVVLPILDTRITPHVIAQARGKEIMALIKLFAAYRGVNAGISGIMMEKVIRITDAVSAVRFSSDNIKNLISGLIGTGCCSMIKHLVGRFQFSHQLLEDDVCMLLEQYIAAYIYDDETFMPLLVFLVNGYADDASCKQYLSQFSSRLLERNGGVAASQVYMKLKNMAKRPSAGHVSTGNAMANYIYMPDDGFGLCEILFRAIIRNRRVKDEFVCFMGAAQGARVPHIIRYIPSSWTRRNVKICIDIAEQAIRQENLAVLEEILIVFVNIKQTSKNMCRLFGNLLKSRCRDYMGLVLRIIDYDKLHYLKRKKITDWLLEQLVGYEMHWCIPYLEGHVNDLDRYGQAIAQYHQEIMNGAATKTFQLSSQMRGLIRYDARNTFFIENLREYLGVLLRMSTDRYIIQQLLTEICSTRAFSRIISESKMAGICKLFKAHRDYFFYLDAFYHALPYIKQKICLKILMIDDLERSIAAKNPWARASAKDGALHRLKKYRQCRGHKCVSTNCKFCEIVYDVAFEDLFAALRYAYVQAKQ